MLDAKSKRLEPGLGDNNPPTPFEEIQTRINDLYDEAKQWLDGEPIDSQAMADAVNGLIVHIRDAEKEAEFLRKTEVAPFDEAKAEIQIRYNLLIGNNKSVKGKTVLAIDVARKALTPWLEKIDAIQRENERIAREEANKVRAAAEEAFRQSQPDDLDAREQAERLLDDAKEAETIAARAKKAKPTAKGGAGRATSLRTYYHANITDRTAFARYLWIHRESEMNGFLQEMAQKMVDQNHNQTIPGVAVVEEKRAV